EELARCEEVIQSLRSFWRSSDEVTRNEFETFTREALQNRPSIQALEWIPTIPASERDSWEARARAEGIEDFQIWQLALGGGREPATGELSYPVYFAEPRANNEAAFGFDLGSNPARLEALRAASRLDRLVATPPIQLVQDNETQPGFLMLLPILVDDTKPLAPQSTALGVLRIVDLVQRALIRQRRDGITVRISDTTQAVPTLVYQESDGHPIPTVDASSPASRVQSEQQLEIGGRTWTVQIFPDNAYLEQVESWAPWWLFISALVVSGSMASLLLVWSGRTRHTEQLVEQQTRELAVANAELETKNEALQRTNEELEHFTSVASHDLDEPLRTVLKFAELLEEDYAGRVLDGTGQAYLERIAKSAQRQQRLIRDLLEYTRTEAGDLELKPVNLQSVVDGVQGDLAASIREAEADLEATELPPVLGDELHLRVLLQNLISNGIKYRREGVSPRIEISAASAPDKPGWVRIEVKDNGIGMDPKHKDRVFELFKRLHTRATYEGTGLGLSICRRIVLRHGGVIGVDSVLGEGTTFHFTLQRAAEA
ncbi:MAG: sensor histidine kinase, partial [Planctomycetota bacterium]